MKVLVINCGSSSLKYQVIDMTNEELICKGLVERIGIEGSVIEHKRPNAEKFVLEVPMKDHKEAIGHVIDALTDKDHGVIADMSEIGAVGHRVAHGGEYFSKSEIITDKAKEEIAKLFTLAPLHNPANMLGIEACMEAMPGTPMVAAFDTSFHQTMPKESYMYALPYEYYEKYGVRRYGFHGTSHRFVSEKAAKMLGKDIEDTKIITCHLGNGSSITAVKGGKCFDTSMGLTPLEGMVMGTRCGDVDPAAITFIQEKENLDPKATDAMMNKKSGLLGLSGVSSDMRDVQKAAAEGNERAQMTLDVFVHRVKHYIGAYAAEMNGVDAIVFTAGIGENDTLSRKLIMDGLDFLGIEMDPAKENVRGEDTVLSTEDSKVKVFLIPTNEELMIARDTYAIVKGI